MREYTRIFIVDCFIGLFDIIPFAVHDIVGYFRTKGSNFSSRRKYFSPHVLCDEQYIHCDFSKLVFQILFEAADSNVIHTLTVSRAFLCEHG